MNVTKINEAIKLKAKHDFLAELIKDAKKNRSRRYREGRKYTTKYGHHLNSETDKSKSYLAIHGIKQEGIAGHLDYKLKEYAVEYRALSIALAFLHNKRFDGIEKFWYNYSMSDLITKKIMTYSNMNTKYYSVYGDKYGRQAFAINHAKVLLGMFKYEPVYSPHSKKFSHNKTIYVNDEEFNEWLQTTSNHFFREDLGPISLTHELELHRDSHAGKDLNPIVQWTKEKNTVI